ncbi:MAG: single-stranded DNA-binding protein [Verrucomicrobiaceae bacterium]|nr:single-stranded DNA-binding protein [Verrucomicrobiaceae bacterium]
MNKAMIMGNLGKDPELTQSKAGLPICKFPIATSRKVKDEEYTTWHNVTAFGRTAEILGQYMEKGRKLLVEGRIENGSYDKEDGTKGYTSEIIVDQFHFVGNKQDGVESAPQPGSFPSQEPAQTQGVDLESPPY